MATLTDLFPASSLDSNLWNSTTTGAGAFVVGTPSDGVWPSGIASDGDSVLIDSENKIVMPDSVNFDCSIRYYSVEPALSGLYSSIFLAWRSAEKSGGLSVDGIDIELVTRPGPTHTFEKVIRTAGVDNRIVLIADPSSGGDGGLRIERIDSTINLYTRDATNAEWTIVDETIAPSTDQGFLVFGTYAAEIPDDMFDWIY